MLTVYLANKNIRVVTGDMSGGKLHVKEACRKVDGGGAILNGSIVDRDALLALLKELWEEKKLPKKDVNLVLDTNQFTDRQMRTPALKDRKMMEYLEREFTGVERMSDPIYGYFQLEKPDKVSKLQKIMAIAAPREFAEQYMTLFKELDISLSGMESSGAAMSRLLAMLTSLKDKTCVIQFVDDMSLTNVLWYNNSVETSNRKRLFSDPGTPAYAVEIARGVKNLIQFAKAQNLEAPITNVYIAGIADMDYAVYEDGVANVDPDLQVEPLSKGDSIVMSGDNFYQYALPVGGLIRTDEDTNIATQLKYTVAELESRRKKKRILIPSLIAVAVLAVTSGTLFVRNMLMQRQLEDINRYIQDPDVVVTCAKYDVLGSRIQAAEGISGGLNSLKDTLDRYPVVDRKVEEIVERCANGLVTATVSGYTANNGQLSMETKAADVEQINRFVDLLRQQDIFAGVTYTGYAQDQEGTWNVNVYCVMAPEKVQEVAEQ